MPKAQKFLANESGIHKRLFDPSSRSSANHPLNSSLFGLSAATRGNSDTFSADSEFRAASHGGDPAAFPAALRPGSLPE